MPTDPNIIDAVAEFHQQAGDSLAFDKSPDDAARAFELSSASGVPAEHIANDIEGFETQHKQALGQSIIDNNPHVLGFINSHPLHGQLVNDDLGNLDKFSRSFKRLVAPPFARQAAEGFSEGFGGLRGFGEWQNTLSPEWKALSDKYPFASQLWTALGVPIELGARLFMGGLEATKRGVEGLARDAGADPSHAESLGNEIAAIAEQLPMMPELRMAAGLPRANKPEGVEPEVDLGRRQFLQGVGATAAAALTKSPALEGALKTAFPKISRLTDLETPQAFARQYIYMFGDNERMAAEHLLDLAGDATNPNIARAYLNAAKMIQSGFIKSIPSISEMAAEQSRSIGDAFRALNQQFQDLRPWAEAGEIPPEGVSEVVDKGRGEQAKIEQDQIKEALDDAKATNLKERSPDKFSEFMDAHPAGTISIDKAGIEAKPEAFKWIDPAKLQSPLSTVEVPAKDFVANFDPELWPEVKDFVSKSGTSVEAAKEIVAYHGSPHDFEKFDLSKIGTGEGAQAYGHGLYFAEREAVAKSYRDTADATVNGRPFDINNPLHKAAQLADELDSREAALAHTRDMLKRDPDSFWEQVIQHLEGDKPLPKMESSGRMYQVSIKADPEHFLDWDKPPSEQSEQVRQRLTSLGVDHAKYSNIQTMMDDLGDPTKPGYDQAAISEKLRAAGIPGIKYLDQGSRAGGEGTRNYVVFDPDLLEITHKDGEPVSPKEREEELLRRKVLQRGRTGRPIRTEPLSSTDPLVGTIRRAAGLEAEPIAERSPSGEVFERAEAYGRTEKEYAKIQKLMAEQDAADVAYAKKKAEKAAALANSAEWKAEDAKIRPEIESEVRSRPEVAAYQFLAKGEYMGEKVPRRLKIAREYLSKEQADAIPAFVSDRGVHPDGIANLFGFPDGNALVDALASVERQTAEGKGDVVKRLTDSEVARRLEAKLGPSAAERLEEARDQALSTTTMELLHERTLALGQRAGMIPPREGFTRLYRGETSGASEAPSPDWVKETPEYKATVAATGRWFSKSRSDAEYYDKVHGTGQGRISFVDVPSGKVESYLAANQPEAARFSAQGRAQEEYFIPRDIADQAQRLGPDVELPLSKAEMDRGASRFLADERFGSLTTDRLLGEAAKASRRVEQAMTAGDWQEAFRQQQLHYSLTAMAKEFRGDGRALRRFDRQAKTFSKRPTPEDPIIGGVQPEYTNWVQDILSRTGRRVLRSVQDLQREIGEAEYTNLTDFVIGKGMMGHDIYMPDFLLDPDFRKPLEDMTVAEARQTMKAVRSLIEVGRDERKATIATEKMDLTDARQQAIDQIAKSQGGEMTTVAPSNPIRAAGRWILARSMQMESLLNRFDLGNPRGFFNRGIFRPLAEAANGEAKMDREVASQIRSVKYKGNLNEAVPNTLFKDPNSTTTDAKGNIDWNNARPYIFTRKNLLAVMHNLGNADNIARLAEGYGLKPEQILQWVNTVATPEDWRYVSEFGKIFERLKTTSDDMYRRLTGVAPESIELVPIQTPAGQVDGWYHPIIHDPLYRGRHLPTGEKLFDEYYVQAGSPNGYTKARTGYRGPLSLELDMVAQRIKQEIHDIQFREPVIEASKILLDRSVKNAVDRYYGKAFGDELRPFIEDVANIANRADGPSAAAARWVEFFRQNTIATLVGLNIRTVQKHTLTAAINSMTEVGAENFLREFGSLLSQGERAGESNWRFAMTKSEELQRRHQNYQEMVKGAYGSAVEATGYGTFGTLRQTMLRLGTAPVALGDLLSSVPTWLAAYKDQIAKGLSEGDAVSFADRAVRRAHGSSAITSRPGVMRGGPLAQTFASLYGFFNHILQRQYELAWQAKLSLGQTTRADVEAALGKKPSFATGLFSYVLAPAIVEELVTPYTNEERDSWGMKAAKTLAFGLSSSWIGVRDVVHAAITNGDVSLGILNTPFKDIQTFVNDVKKGEVSMDRAHAGKTIRHATTALGTLTGLGNAEMGNLAEYLLDYANGKQTPRDLTDWYRGLTKGEQRPRSGPDLIEKLLVEGGAGHYSQRKR